MAQSDSPQDALGAWLLLDFPATERSPERSEIEFVSFVGDDEIPGVDPEEIDESLDGPDDIDYYLSLFDDKPFLSECRLHYGPEDRAAFEAELTCKNPVGAWVHISYPDQRDGKPTKSGKHYSRPDTVVFFAFTSPRRTIPGIRPKDIFMRVSDKGEIESLKDRPTSDWRIEGYRLYYAPRPAAT